MKHVLIPLPQIDFDPTEAAIPWNFLNQNGVKMSFATPYGQPSSCDPRMISGSGLGILTNLLRADQNGRDAYDSMSRSKEFQNPLRYSELEEINFDAVLLPGGHAPGMREYLESSMLQNLVADFASTKKPIAAICHGVVVAARSGILKDKKTTSLLATQELVAWALTCAWLGSYYRTYPQTVESEVRTMSAEFIRGPMPLLRDSPEHLERGFFVRDKNYLSARWPGDAHIFATEFLQML